MSKPWLASALMFLFAATAQANDDAWSARDRVDARMGIGYGELQTPIVNKQTAHYQLLPQLAWYGEKFYFENGLFGYALTETTHQQWDLVLYPNDDGVLYKLTSALAPAVSATPFPVYRTRIDIIDTPERRVSGMLGLRYAQQHDNVDYSVQAGVDISGVHHGWELSVKLNKFALLEKHDFRLDGDVGIAIKSHQIVDYYYTPQFGEMLPVEGDEWLNCRDVDHCQLETVGPYSGATAYRVHASLNAHYALNDQWEWLVLYRHFYLSHSMTKSPLVAVDHYAAWFSGLMYRF